MSDYCGKCGSSDLGSVENDLWHYSRKCKNCGAWTRFNSKGKIVDCYGGDTKKDDSPNLGTIDMENLKWKSDRLHNAIDSGKWNYKHNWGKDSK